MHCAIRQAVRRVLGCGGLLAGALCALAVNCEALHAAESAFVLSVRGDRLTVQLHHVPLGQVLAELARQARIRVQLPPSMQADPISDAFADLPLEQGIARLLQGRSFAIFHESPSAQPIRSGDIAATQLWVLPKPDQAGLAPAATDAQEGWSRRAFLDDADPARRLAALDDLTDRGDTIAIDALAQAMVDADDAVRAKAQALFDRALLEIGTSSAPVPRAR